MVQTTLKVDGMMCGMCESHVNEVVRKTAQVEKVTSSHTKGETVIVSAQPLDIEALKAAIADGASGRRGSTKGASSSATGRSAAPRWIGWPPSTRWPRTTATTSFS